MPKPGHSIHHALASFLSPSPWWRVADLGCGEGGTLAVIAESSPETQLYGYDVDPKAVESARTLLAKLEAEAELAVHDLSKPTPLPAGSVDGIVCHDVLEFLPNPPSLIAEAVRALRPGGAAVFSHTDYDALIIRAGNKELTRAVCHGWAEFPEEWMEYSDAWMGRKVASLVRSSPLHLETVETHVTIATELEGFAHHRVHQIAGALRERGCNNTGPLSVAEVDEWVRSVEDAARSGEFFFAETAFLVRATKVLD